MVIVSTRRQSLDHDKLTSPSSLKVGQNPKDKHGGNGDGVSTLLQHHLIPVHNLTEAEDTQTNCHALAVNTTSYIAVLGHTESDRMNEC